MKVIIFGSSGQDGIYLSKLLEKQGIEVLKVSRSGNGINGSVADFGFVSSIVEINKPDFIFHLAAVSTTRHSALFDNHQAISTGTFNILESVRLHCQACRVFLSGSAMQFKNIGEPIDENTPFEASSPYSVSRIHSVYAGRYYRSAFGMKIYTGYFFNHDSPLRSVNHINQKIVSVVCRIARGSDEKLELGNIDVQKEFSFAGDIVEAIWKLVNQDDVFEAVIGSGKAYSIKDFTEYCFKKINKNYQDYLIIKEDFTPEYSVLVSNPSVIREIGWQSKTDFYQLADLMMESYDHSC
jgi:GDPmannose 4,6-dehydratase